LLEEGHGLILNAALQQFCAESRERVCRTEASRETASRSL
jgi:hypothetical protein